MMSSSSFAFAPHALEESRCQRPDRSLVYRKHSNVGLQLTSAIAGPTAQLRTLAAETNVGMAGEAHTRITRLFRGHAMFHGVEVGPSDRRISPFHALDIVARPTGAPSPSEPPW